MPAPFAPPRFRALLLDFDGVVLQTAALKNRAFAAAYAGADPKALQEITDYAEAHGGVTRRDKFAHIERSWFGRDADGPALDRLTAGFRARVFDAVLAADFVPGAERFLDLASASMAVHLVSGTPHEELLEVVRARGFGRWFASVDGAPPDKRATFARLLREHGYAPSEALAVGDALTEYEAARALGVPFLAIVPPGARNRFPADVPAVPSLEPAPALLGLD